MPGIPADSDIFYPLEESSAAHFNASFMLAGSAKPLPAISKDVPWAVVAQGTGNSPERLHYADDIQLSHKHIGNPKNK